MKVIFVCGGTSGHINPALAIAEEMKQRIPCEILFIGADKPLEKRLVPSAGFRLENIQMSGLNRSIKPRNIIHNVKAILKLIKANIKSTRIIKGFMPDVVIGTGGYICYPVLKKASKFGISTFVLEPNAYPGLTVRMLAPIVDKIFVTYRGMEKKFKRSGDVVVFTGTPLQSQFVDGAEVISSSNSTNISRKPLVVSYWGSLGASGMNEMMTQFIKRNIKENKFNHIHATGVNDSKEKLLESLKGEGIETLREPLIDIREYIENMPTVMNDATIVLSRAGASTVAELTALGKPAILIPSPYVTDNHQEENAKQLQSAGGAIMIKESECTGDKLFDMTVSIINDNAKLKEMAAVQKSLSVRDAAEKIVDIVMCTIAK
ncbi:MAG: UDP-N-acetylglucosamine--N-acetylmuramyl-(pentapeptide) pyrophosphoryl-undecaprenol N-acetylglucosamine transferase [Oscillospiraceae bacterium]|nr:UDP-N-acetylglucosamine--N-acetylmuramyl-(pentapeptide) pyrophosphoryl-undecaprenol N-acetylglucosamine transferase [Oscillospiraceae bacterium]